MTRKTVLSILSFLSLASAAFAQMPTTVAVEEYTSADNLVPFRKLLTEYSVTELAACNLMKVLGYDTVNAAKAKLKIDTLTACDAKQLSALLAELKADAVCVGNVTRTDKGVEVRVRVFKDGAFAAKEAFASMKNIEGSDDAAKKLAEQVECIVKGASPKPLPYDVVPSVMPPGTSKIVAPGPDAAAKVKAQDAAPQ